MERSKKEMKVQNKGRKWLLLAVFGLLLIFLQATVYAALGDVNNNGSIDIVDALLTAQYSVGLNPSNFTIGNADVNASGSVDIVDALLIAQYSVGLITQFPGQSETPVPTAVSTPGPTTSSEVCGQYDIIEADQYFMMNNIWGEGAGTQCIWYTDVNSWGVSAQHNSGDGIKAYPALVRGCHWATCGTNTGLPKQSSSLGTLTTSWTQSPSGTAWNASYDIWFHPTSDPGSAAAQYELMIWLNWTDGFNPIAEQYDANGAIPYASNVSLGGNTFMVYHRGDVFTFRLSTRSNSINVDVKPIINYVVQQGWMSSSVYCVSVQAGWEIIQGGTFSTTAYSVTIN
jgi:hypothetical protein